ncbi:UNVERIFIED_CONTAM: zinc finger and BTB domain-containing protein 46 [Trichonephila clavipes]
MCKLIQCTFNFSFCKPGFIQKHCPLHFCPYCEYSTVHATVLKRHIRRHTGERPFVCRICGKGFAQKHRVITHQKVHSSCNNNV